MRNLWTFLSGALLLFTPVTAAQEPIQIGWIDDFNATEVPADHAVDLNRRIVSFARCGNSANRVSLVDCSPELMSPDEGTVQAVCGETLKIPEDWDLAADGRLLRGVWMSAFRPQERERQAWIKKQKRSDSRRITPNAQWPVLSANDVPSDVVVFIDRQGNWSIGCDLDLDQQIQPDEQFDIAASEVREPKMIRFGNEVLLIDAKALPVPSLSMALMSSPSGDREADNRLPAISPLVWRGIGDEDTKAAQWHLFAKGQGPADLAIAVEAAAAAKCDFILVNLQTRNPGNPLDQKYQHTDRVRLLADWSRAFQLPIVVNVATPWSPRFLVVPGRRSIPEIAESRFSSTKSSNELFHEACRDAFRRIDVLRRATQAMPVTGELTQVQHYVNTHQDALPTERFVKLLSEKGADGQSTFAVRVPFNAIDGRVVLPDSESSFDELALSLYDFQGQRISGREHSQDIPCDHFPPIESVSARGGYLLSTSGLIDSNKTHTADSESVRIRWRCAPQAVQKITWQPGEVTQSIRIQAAAGVPKKLDIQPLGQTSPLEHVALDSVPASVRTAAGELLDRGDHVATYWYHEAPRQGDGSLRRLFQTAESASLWPSDRLQYTVIYETGKVGARSHSIGDSYPCNSMDAWVLVQAAISPPDYPPHLHSSPLRHATAPELFQYWEPDAGQDSQAVQWKRTAICYPSSQSSANSSSGSRDHEQRDDKTDRAEHEVEKTEWIATYAGASLFNHSHPQSSIATSQWARIGDGDHPAAMLGVLEITNLPSQRRAETWQEYYDHDVLTEAIDVRRQAGQAPAQILAATPKPPRGTDASGGLVDWRRYLLALDQPELRKTHLEETIEATRQVLQRCRTRLGGMPPAKDPYHVQTRPTTAPGQNASANEDRFRMPTDQAGLRVYAWAVEAQYRQVRSIGYRELPDVVAEHPIADREAQDKAYESAFYQLCGMVDIKTPRFALTLVRYHRRRSESYQGYLALRRYAYAGPAMRWYFKKERDLFRDAGNTPLTRLANAQWFLRQSGYPITGNAS